jgi:hypothetical protein
MGDAITVSRGFFVIDDQIVMARRCRYFKKKPGRCQLSFTGENNVMQSHIRFSFS